MFTHEQENNLKASGLSLRFCCAYSINPPANRSCPKRDASCLENDDTGQKHSSSVAQRNEQSLNVKDMLEKERHAMTRILRSNTVKKHKNIPTRLTYSFCASFVSHTVLVTRHNMLQARPRMIPSLKSASVTLRKELFNTDFDSYKLSDDKLFNLEKTLPLRPRISSSLPFPSDYSATSFR